MKNSEFLLTTGFHPSELVVFERIEEWEYLSANPWIKWTKEWAVHFKDRIHWRKATSHFGFPWKDISFVKSIAPELWDSNAHLLATNNYVGSDFEKLSRQKEFMDWFDFIQNPEIKWTKQAVLDVEEYILEAMFLMIDPVYGIETPDDWKTIINWKLLEILKKI